MRRSAALVLVPLLAASLSGCLATTRNRANYRVAFGLTALAGAGAVAIGVSRNCRTEDDSTGCTIGGVMFDVVGATALTIGIVGELVNEFQRTDADE